MSSAHARAGALPADRRRVGAARTLVARAAKRRGARRPEDEQEDNERDERRWPNKGLHRPRPPWGGTRRQTLSGSKRHRLLHHLLNNHRLLRHHRLPHHWLRHHWLRHHWLRHHWLRIGHRLCRGHHAGMSHGDRHADRGLLRLLLPHVPWCTGCCTFVAGQGLLACRPTYFIHASPELYP